MDNLFSRVGRWNSGGGGRKTTAILARLTSTCRRHRVDAQLYLTQLLTNLPGTPMSQLDQWLPDRWKAPHAATIPGVQFTDRSAVAIAALRQAIEEAALHAVEHHQQWEVGGAVT